MVPVVFLLLSAWLMVSVSHVLGFSPSDRTRDVGVAQIISCERTPLRLWLIHHCEAEIRWERKVPADETAEAVRTRVTSTRDLEGQVPVIERIERTGRSADWTVVPLDHPVNNNDGLIFVLLLFVLGAGVAGVFVGLKIAHRLPEPPDRGRLTLRMAALDERGQPRRSRRRRRR
ncbi:hypothetical protein [Actinokineospora xionganensis]|uniref:DUF3592 domain-containing protein n=1 Tax=Actinokineospora xionganensis TaxID=2684470 RepID=A0ABR7L9M7_9PSEU|nr:hypothetical protein [Actinokineospora xionganensis]MBC6449292.1 hypothetical protein [Actinokineospora xionganensis]